MKALLASCSLAIALLLPSLVRAEDALDAFPPETAAVVRFSSLEKFAGGFQEMTAGLGPLALVGAQIDGGLGEIFQAGTGQDAIDRKAPAYVAVFPIDGNVEPVAYLVRTENQDKLRRAVLRAGADETLTSEKGPEGFDKVTKGDRSFFFGAGPALNEAGKWVLYTRNETVAKLLSFDHQKGTVAKIIEPRAAEVLAAGDGAVVVNLSRLNEVYGGQIDEGRRATLRGIEQLQDAQLTAGGADAATTRKLYASLANMGFDAIKEATWAAGRVRFSGAGLTLAGLLIVKPGGQTDELLTGNPTTAFENLGLLPQGASVYFGADFKSKKLAALGVELQKGSYGGNAQNSEARAAAEAQAAKAGPVTQVGSFALPSGPATGMANAILRAVENPELLRTASRDLAKVQGETKNPLFTQTTEYKEAAETYKEHPVDIMIQRFQLAKVDDMGLAIGQQVMKKFLGGEAVETRVCALEGMLVQASGNGPGNLQRVIDGLESGEGVLGIDEAYAKTRDQLAEQANMIALFNVPQLVVDFAKILREISPFDMILGQVPFNFGAKPVVSFGGLTIGTEPQGLKLQIYIPVEQVKGILGIFGQG